MIYLLDTNVLSETMRSQPDAAVASWLRAQPLRSLCTAAICQAEILSGIAVLPEGRRRADLERMAQAVFTEDFEGRILPFGAAAAARYADVTMARRKAGKPMAGFDGLIAAIALAAGTRVATRDVGGFEGCGVQIIDPWKA